MAKKVAVGLAEIVKYQKAPIRFMNQEASRILTQLLDESRLNVIETREWLKVNDLLNTTLDAQKAARKAQGD